MQLSPEQSRLLSAEMVAARDSKRCSVCNASPIEMHHVKPVEYGGPEDGLTLPVCGTCHTRIHRMGESAVDTGSMDPYIQEYPPALQPRAVLLAQQIATAKTLFLDSGATRSATARNAIQVHFSNDELGAAHDLKRKLGFRSLERLIKHLILTEWMNRNARS